MKNRKQKSEVRSQNPENLALIATERADALELYEREISLDLEVGGRLHLTTRSDAIGTCIAGVLSAFVGALKSGVVENDQHISVSFRYWQLNEELDDLTIKSGAADWLDEKQNPELLIRQLIARAKVKFATAIAAQGIVLKTPLGELEEA